MSSPLKMVFDGPTSTFGANYVMLPQFNDMSFFLWDPTTPVSASLWSGTFCDPITAIPADHLSATVMTNVHTFTWAFPSVSGSTMNSFEMPLGLLSLGQVLTAIYAATGSIISREQYKDITKQDYTGTTPPTRAQALRDNAAALDYQLQLFEIVQESPTVIRINC